MRFVSVVISFYQTFSCLLLPTVLVHLYGVIGISLLEWSVCTRMCVHAHTHMRTSLHVSYSHLLQWVSNIYSSNNNPLSG